MATMNRPKGETMPNDSHNDADTCCDDYAIEHPGATYCPRCQLVNEGTYPSSAGIRGAQ